MHYIETKKGLETLLKRYLEAGEFFLAEYYEDLAREMGGEEC